MTGTERSTEHSIIVNLHYVQILKYVLGYFGFPSLIHFDKQKMKNESKCTTQKHPLDLFSRRDLVMVKVTNRWLFYVNKLVAGWLV